MTMKTGTWVCGSCAAYSIENLGDSADVLQAMLEFCKQQLIVESRYGEASYQKLASHYVFVAGPEVPGSGHSKAWVRYGTEFAQLITDNSLGQVVTLSPVKNVKHHPQTTCQVWVWQPDQAALQKWHEGNKEKVKLEKGVWTTAVGVVGSKCQHCKKIFASGEKMYFTTGGVYMCEEYGIAAEKG